MTKCCSSCVLARTASLVYDLANGRDEIFSGSGLDPQVRNVDRCALTHTVKFAGWVYVLHCFQKKSKSGIKTPAQDLDLINARLRAAKQDFEAWEVVQGAH